MTSKSWAKEAAKILVEELGVDRTHQIIQRLKRIPGPSKSVEQTLIRLTNGVKEIKRES